MAMTLHELGPQVVGEDPMFSERIYEKLYAMCNYFPLWLKGITL